MRISVRSGWAQNVRPGELAWRFLLGATITATAGLIAGRYGPAVGGLFLAFPAILPASLTLVAKHQERRKAELGLHGIVRGRQAASLDAFGALMGAAGLAGFAVVVQIAATRVNALLTLLTATVVWLVVAAGVWRFRAGPFQ